MKAKSVFLMLMLGTTLLFYRCSEDTLVDDTSNDVGTIEMKGAKIEHPDVHTGIKFRCSNFGDITAAQGVLDKITLQSVGATGSDKFTEIYSQVETFDILNMNVGILADIAFVPIPPGVYSKAIVRMLRTKDPRLDLLPDSLKPFIEYKGDKYPFRVPHGNMVIKFVEPIEVITALSQDILLDIDVSKSFIPVYREENHGGEHMEKREYNRNEEHNDYKERKWKGRELDRDKERKPAYFIFKPVVKAINNTSTGSIFISAVTPIVANPTTESDFMNLGGAEIWLNGAPLYCDAQGTVCTTLTEPIYHPYYPPDPESGFPGVVLFDIGQFVIPGLTPGETYTVELKKAGYSNALSTQTIINGNFSFAAPMVMIPAY